MIIRQKRCNDELKASRPTYDEVENIPRIPISFLVENIRSVHNVGAIFRTADGMGAEKIYLTGYTAYPPRDDLSKVALGADKSVPWEYINDPEVAINIIKKQNITIAALEQTKESISIYDFNWEFPICVILGNEVKGVSEALINHSHHSVEIPMRGIKQSLNVSVAAGVIGYEGLRKYYL